MKLHFVDLFSHFPAFWSRIQSLPLSDQIHQWAEEFMAEFPDIRDHCIEDYQKEGYNWIEVAKNHVFPKFSQNSGSFLKLGQSLQQIIPPLNQLFLKRFELDIEILYVIYIGIGNGAGWVTYLQQQPAIFFGVENIAECGWTTDEALRGLVAHELGHVYHYHLRKKKYGEESPTAMFWELYEEGFAQMIEHELQGYPSFHMQESSEGWLEYCKKNRRSLLKLYLKAVEVKDREKMRQFFGSWYQIDGYSQIGYYLGSEILTALHSEHSLNTIALWTQNEIDEYLFDTIQSLTL